MENHTYDITIKGTVDFGELDHMAEEVLCDVIHTDADRLKHPQLLKKLQEGGLVFGIKRIRD